MSSETAPLSKLQRQMLKLFALEVPEEDLIAIQQLIARYFAEKAMDLADQSWDEKGWSEEDASRLLDIKMRTPYRTEKK